MALPRVERVWLDSSPCRRLSVLRTWQLSFTTVRDPQEGKAECQHLQYRRLRRYPMLSADPAGCAVSGVRCGRRQLRQQDVELRLLGPWWVLDSLFNPEASYGWCLIVV